MRRLLTEAEARELASEHYTDGEELEMDEEYRCPGCEGLCLTPEQLEHHQQGCILWLRARAARCAELEAELEAHGESHQRETYEDFTAEYRHRKARHQEQLDWERSLREDEARSGH